jgi:hypothetical protein
LAASATAGPLRAEEAVIINGMNTDEVASYAAVDSADGKYDGKADGLLGEKFDRTAKPVGSTLRGLCRFSIFFRLPKGMDAAKLTKATLKIHLRQVLPEKPMRNLDVFHAAAPSMGKAKGPFGKQVFSDPSFKDTGLGIALEEAVPETFFVLDVTEFVRADLSAGAAASAFRLQLADDTGMDFGSREHYEINDFEPKSLERSPELAIEFR